MARISSSPCAVAVVNPCQLYAKTSLQFAFHFRSEVFGCAAVRDDAAGAFAPLPFLQLTLGINRKRIDATFRSGCTWPSRCFLHFLQNPRAQGRAANSGVPPGKRIVNFGSSQPQFSSS